MLHKIFRRTSEVAEICFYIEIVTALTGEERDRILEIIRETFEPELTQEEESFFCGTQVLEIGPRMAFETPFSSNAVSICHAIGIEKVVRIEPAMRYFCRTEGERQQIMATAFDRMTQQVYPEGIKTFDSGLKPEPVRIISLLEEGITALQKENKELGLGMDGQDVDFYFDYFARKAKRNPTDTELFQLGNNNSEHSRHGFWKGIQIIDGLEMPESLLDLARKPLRVIEGTKIETNVSLAAFNDNSGVILGRWATMIVPDPRNRMRMIAVQRLVHPTATGETHNHPTAVSPIDGADTGAGGMERDKTATGRGARNGMTAAGYFTGNRFFSGYLIPGEMENTGRVLPYATPLRIIHEGSNGVSRYDNQLGVPVTYGFDRTFGQYVAGELRQPFKPILYAAGTGFIFDKQVKKAEPERGMIIVAIGGSALRVGFGGGAASSMVHGENEAGLDYKSVQRGNAAKENGDNRVIVACSEMEDENPIASMTDQGAGGNANDLSELMGKAGGRINIRRINVGDKTLSVTEIWCAEYQERYGLLIYPERLPVFQEICDREKVACEVLGKITGDGRVVVYDPQDDTTPVELNLEAILGNLPRKVWRSERIKRELPPVEIPKDLTVAQAFEMVCKLPAVGSKGHLVNKADNHVGGNIIQQQRCGIMAIPISDYALCATGYFDRVGTVSSLGENPNRILIDPKAGVRMAIAEAITNMAGVKIDGIHAIRARANWMWPAKLPGEGPLLYDAVSAMSEFLIGLGFATDGGKDSSSMATIIGDETVRAPGSLVFMPYASVPDFNVRVTPDIKNPGRSELGLIDLGRGKNRLGGSALAQALGQLGNETPDIEASLLGRAFNAVQQMLSEGLILALHDRSDGGLLVAVAEMCMASNCGFDICLMDTKTIMEFLFTEECGWVIEFDQRNEARLDEICSHHGIGLDCIGRTLAEHKCFVRDILLSCAFVSDIAKIRSCWEATSLEHEKLQNAPVCVESLRQSISEDIDVGPDNAHAYRLTFTPVNTSDKVLNAIVKPKMAVLRDEGTNGDPEMRAMFLTAGFEVFDFAMTDLLAGRASLDDVQMAVLAGGFSYRDTFGSAKGWEAVVRHNPRISEMFDRFYNRSDTLSLGVCNGCQWDALAGWVPRRGIERNRQPRFIGNISGKFESRWVQVEILPSPAVLLAGMEGSRLGVWVAHGEGRCFFPDKSILEEAQAQKLAPLTYIDPLGNTTERYPYNPNGSSCSIAALCTADGRHLAMMPHPERVFRLSRWMWNPKSWENPDDVSPWLKMPQNAREWCLQHR